MTKMLIPAYALVKAENTSIGPSIFYFKDKKYWIKTEVNKIKKNFFITVCKGSCKNHPYIDENIDWREIQSMKCKINQFPKCPYEEVIHRQINIINGLITNG